MDNTASASGSASSTPVPVNGTLCSFDSALSNSVTPSLASVDSHMRSHMHQTQYWSVLQGPNQHPYANTPSAMQQEHHASAADKYLNYRKGTTNKALPHPANQIPPRPQMPPGTALDPEVAQLMGELHMTPSMNTTLFTPSLAYPTPASQPPCVNSSLLAPSPTALASGRAGAPMEARQQRPRQAKRSASSPDISADAMREDAAQLEDRQEQWKGLLRRAKKALGSKTPLSLSETGILNMFERLLKYVEMDAARKTLPRVADSGNGLPPSSRGVVLKSVSAEDSSKLDDSTLPHAHDGPPGGNTMSEALDEAERLFVQNDLEEMLRNASPNLQDSSLMVEGGAERDSPSGSSTDLYAVVFRKGFSAGYASAQAHMQPKESFSLQRNIQSTGGEARPGSRSTKAANFTVYAPEGPAVATREALDFEEVLGRMPRHDLTRLLQNAAASLPAHPRNPQDFPRIVRSLAKGHSDVARLKKYVMLASDKLKYLLSINPRTGSALSRDDAIKGLFEATGCSSSLLDHFPAILERTGSELEGSLAEYKELLRFRVKVADLIGFVIDPKKSSIFEIVQMHSALLEKLQLSLNASGAADAYGLTPTFLAAEELRERTLQGRIGLDPTGKDGMTRCADTIVHSYGPARMSLCRQATDEALHRHPKLLIRLTDDEAYDAFAAIVFVMNYFGKMFEAPSVGSMLPKISELHIFTQSARNLIAAVKKVTGLPMDASPNRVIEAVQALAINATNEIGVFSPEEAAEILLELNVESPEDVMPAIRLLKGGGPSVNPDGDDDTYGSIEAME